MATTPLLHRARTIRQVRALRPVEYALHKVYNEMSENIAVERSEERCITQIKPEKASFLGFA